MARIIHVALSAATVFAIALFVIATLKNDIVEEEGQTKRFHRLGNHLYHHPMKQASTTTPATIVAVNNNETTTSSNNKSIHHQDTAATTIKHPQKEEEGAAAADGANAFLSPQDSIESSSNDIPAEEQPQQNSHQQIVDDVDNDEAVAFSLKEITAMRKKLAPRGILRNEKNNNGRGEPLAHQFLHLHHMKTGGTCKCTTTRNYAVSDFAGCGLLIFIDNDWILGAARIQ
jgi:hypothetical protein